MALSALQPLTVDFIDTLAASRRGEEMLAEVEIADRSVLVGRSVADIFQICRNATVLGIQKPSGAMIVGPRGTVVLELGDRLMVMAREEDVAALSRPAARPEAPAVPSVGELEAQEG